ncbi:hypothetical protein KX729_25565 [Rhizobium sp. XQZ8]|nr:hypothetical protein [Rhizobium populisoli]
MGTRPPIGHRFLSIKLETLAQIGVFSTELFSQELAQPMVLFFQLKEIRHLVTRRSYRHGISGSVGETEIT